DSSRPSVSNIVPLRKSFVLINAGEKLHGEYVPVEAEACDHSPRGTRGDAAGAELLAGVDVGDVHLHHRHRERLETIVEGKRVVRERARVDDDPGRGRRLLLQEVDDLAFVVALEQRHLRVALSRGFANHLVQVGQRSGAVDVRLALAEQVQVGAVDDADLHPARAVRTTRLTRPGGTSCPISAKPMRRGSTQATRPRSAFLSVGMVARTLSTGTLGETSGRPYAVSSSSC